MEPSALNRLNYHYCNFSLFLAETDYILYHWGRVSTCNGDYSWPNYPSLSIPAGRYAAPFRRFRRLNFVQLDPYLQRASAMTRLSIHRIVPLRLVRAYTRWSERAQLDSFGAPLFGFRRQSGENLKKLNEIFSVVPTPFEKKNIYWLRIGKPALCLCTGL